MLQPRSIPATVLLFLALLPKGAMSFIVGPIITPRTTTRHSYHPNQSTRMFASTEQPPLTIREIKQELQDRKINYTDCFDKESLLQRLQQAKDGTVKSDAEDSHNDDATTATVETHVNSKQEPTTTADSSDQSTAQPPSSSSTPSSDNKNTIDETAMLQEIRSLRVRELREELARRNLRWGGMIEKEDLVQAVFQARKVALNFSATGVLTPGNVAELTGEQLEQELEQKPKLPLLLDAYATWCGPCQMMAPQLVEASQVLGDKVRVAKMDTDQNQAQASKLQVQGLPTLILFRNGKEVDRIEGALMKDQLIQWVESKL